MEKYTPDHWVVLPLEWPGRPVIYKVLAGWSGSYLYGSSWKLNSGIVKATQPEPGLYEFEGYSGSVYVGRTTRYGVGLSIAGVLEDIEAQAKTAGGSATVLPEDTDWTALPYGS